MTNDKDRDVLSAGQQHGQNQKQPGQDRGNQKSQEDAGKAKQQLDKDSDAPEKNKSPSGTDKQRS